jgi:class 3 adenylate cyclase
VRPRLHMLALAPRRLYNPGIMDEPAPAENPQRSPAGLSLRVKITIAFVLIVALVSLALGVSTYTLLNRNLLRELQGRVRNLTYVGSLTLDREALGRLAAQVSQDLPPERVAAIERSADFRTISDQLGRIRDTEPELVRYVYTFVPTAGENTALFLVDADTLPQLEARDAGTEVPEEEFSHFASTFDVSQFPVAQQALREAVPLVENAYTYDEAFRVNSLSGYSPVVGPEGSLLAMLGLDMVDTDARAVLRRTTTVSLIAAGAALLLSLGTSVLFGYLFTRGIVSLDRVVRRFGEKNMEVRAQIHSRDEVGRLGMSFNQMADLIQRHSQNMENLLSAYGRFVPHDLLHLLGKESISDVQLSDHVEMEMTLMFSDIRSFTELSEFMKPQENFNFLNSYLSRVGPEIRAHNGFIDKYVGDAIMALFPGRPDDALEAAVAMRVRIQEYNSHRQSSGYAPIRVGIGIHTGKLMLGTIGERARMDGSVISDTVNLCSRLESLSRIYGDTIVISGYCVSRLENRRQYHIRFIDRVQVRGRRESVPVYEVFDGDPPALREAKAAAKALLTEALQHYYARRFKESYAKLRELKESDPEDPIVALYMKRCARLITHGVPQGWQGVEVIDLK